MTILCIWPNDDYCELEDIEEYGYNKSDDYAVVDLVNYPEAEDIDDFIYLYNRNPQLRYRTLVKSG